MRAVGDQVVPEERETHYCADFFENSQERTVADYVTFAESKIRVGQLVKSRDENYALPTTRNRHIALVVDPDQPGLDALLARSATSQEPTVLASFGVQFPDRTGVQPPTNHRAVLVGIPANYINFVIVGGRLGEDVQRVQEIKRTIAEAGLSIPVLNTFGERID